MASTLAREIFGPGGKYAEKCDDYYSKATEITPTPNYMFPNWDEYNKRHIDGETCQEILKNEAPTRRYGVGILFPSDVSETQDTEKTPDESDAVVEGSSGLAGTDQDNEAGVQVTMREGELKLAKKMADTQLRLASLKDTDDDQEPEDDAELDGLKLARIRKPQSMGVTFLADCSADESLILTIEGGRYRKVEGISVQDSVNSEGKGIRGKRNLVWWVRVPVSLEAELKLRCLQSEAPLRPVAIDVQTPGLPELKLTVEIQSRPVPQRLNLDTPKSARLVTITLVNRSKIKNRNEIDTLSLFQSRFSVRPKSEGSTILHPLPKWRNGSDEEEQAIDLLYRNQHSFASGHGCAGDWEADEGQRFARRIVAEPIPCQETPPVTPELVHPVTNQLVELAILPLATGADGWISPLEELASLYGSWIEEKKVEADRLAERYKSAAKKHLDTASNCLARILAGLELIRTNEEVAKAFHLANEAVLLQQLAGRTGVRLIKYNPEVRRLSWEREITKPSLEHTNAPTLKWRPFQIAFLLMNLQGLWAGDSDDRLIADLIWFPTGGGKTEAYLATTAFLLFARRLQNSEDIGTGVIMRYTLRLLTAQQFQRAAGLICAMETIRNQAPLLLGTSPFSIGIWVGGGTTPNTRQASIDGYNDAKRAGPDKYSHVMLRCPWCGSQMGPRKRYTGKTCSEPGDFKYALDGLSIEGVAATRRVSIHCPDSKCDFHNGLPVCVVDEEIYGNAPSLLIGTVDKFAMLAWKPEARLIFGIDEDGTQRVSPPGLIIQDELHLITGPLGSMVGLYEGVIEELCTDRRNNQCVRPKIIASTATTRASTRQIADLFAREHTAVFPPPGLEATDSFFARYARDGEGKIMPGRLYMGILARSYGSGLTVNVRVFSALLEAAKCLPETERDPWWTLLVFYNSLRELGSGLTLFGADIPERLADLRGRWRPEQKHRRYLNNVLELTGRLSNSEVPAALEGLERKFSDNKVVDACLASNIIEVGVDVPRLGLMSVSGQPKNTAQYIQATGRVGREAPGLVVTIYDNRKSRDLSHLEQFSSYHRTLYAAVEPSTVTPFTIQVMERALHGAFISWIRQKLPRTSSAQPSQIENESPILNAIKQFGIHYLNRLKFLLRNDPTAQSQAEKLFRSVLRRRMDSWLKNKPVKWENQDMTGESEDVPLMRWYGRACKPEWEVSVWPTPTSMRGVDAECEAVVFRDLNENAGGHETIEPNPVLDDILNF